MELIGGGTPKTSNSEYWNGNIPWLSVVDFNTGRKHVYTTEKSITEKGLYNSSTKILNEGDIIISARGTVGVLAALKKPMAFNQSCYGIRAIPEKSDSDFIYYLTKHSINQLQQIAHGGVFDTITRDTFNAIDILLPPLPEQKAIASVLSSLDDKIDLLHRQNATLEAMAETLFRQWFVEEA
ncbi:MAG: restriction endonuclease subunit S, partial [Spirochaetales bacterium]|nr:restriction endonuclease subunit S [Spirochaetales bacterium]